MLTNLTIDGQISSVGAVAVAPSDSNTIYAASGEDQVSKIMVTTKATTSSAPAWTDRTHGLP
jgi:hypothetical protein